MFKSALTIIHFCLLEASVPRGEVTEYSDRQSSQDRDGIMDSYSQKQRLGIVKDKTPCSPPWQGWFCLNGIGNCYLWSEVTSPMPSQVGQFSLKPIAGLEQQIAIHQLFTDSIGRRIQHQHSLLMQLGKGQTPLPDQINGHGLLI
jgi:hypothetical protein